MIYLGSISDRIPIVPPFAPDHHICKVINFGTAINLLILFVQHHLQGLYRLARFSISPTYAEVCDYPF